MFPKKKLASITITDLNCIKKTLDLEANKRKVWLKANAKFQIVNHKRYLIVDFCGVQDGTAAVIFKLGDGIRQSLFAKKRFAIIFGFEIRISINLSTHIPQMLIQHFV